jgi:hypothetical protein
MGPQRCHPWSRGENGSDATGGDTRRQLEGRLTVPGTLTVIWWRDIPAQVIAKDRRQAHKVVLHPRFQVAIDRAAMKAGKKAFSDYIEEWRREARSCGDDLEAIANAEATRLETTYTTDVLNRLVAAGGADADKATTGAPA